jgi:hypothetical protein
VSFDFSARRFAVFAHLESLHGFRNSKGRPGAALHVHWVSHDGMQRGTEFSRTRDLLNWFPRRTAIRSQGFLPEAGGRGQLVIALSRSPSFPGPSPGRMNKEGDQLFSIIYQLLGQ